MKSYLMSLMFLVGIATTFVACDEQGPEYVEDYDLVVTSYDKDFDFGEVNTYSLPDTVMHLVEEDRRDDVEHKYDDEILETIEEEMNALGYTRLTDPNATADVVVTATALSTTYLSGGYYNPGYWWDYWNWYGWYPYYPGFGSGWYPWYGYTPSYYVWEEGTVLIEMLDVKHLNEEEKQIPVVWNAVLNGLLVGSDNSIENRLEKNISQAFSQSTYLGTN